MFDDRKTDPIDFYKSNKIKWIELQRIKNDRQAKQHTVSANRNVYESQNSNKQAPETNYITAVEIVAFRKME